MSSLPGNSYKLVVIKCKAFDIAFCPLVLNKRTLNTRCSRMSLRSHCAFYRLLTWGHSYKMPTELFILGEVFQWIFLSWTSTSHSSKSTCIHNPRLSWFTGKWVRSGFVRTSYTISSHQPFPMMGRLPFTFVCLLPTPVCMMVCLYLALAQMQMKVFKNVYTNIYGFVFPLCFSDLHN